MELYETKGRVYRKKMAVNSNPSNLKSQGGGDVSCIITGVLLSEC